MTDLVYVLRQLPPSNDPRLLVGSNPADDAAVYLLREDLALIQTVDFFTPIVDDPYAYGQIAVANSLSDVYAMGGEPITALNIVGYPVKDLPIEILGEILRGGADKAAEAGVPIVGGHTIDDPEPKYGLAVTATVHPEKYVTAHGAQPGDVLILTKPIGTGVVATALKAGKVDSIHLEQATRWMTTLNRSASLAMLAAIPHAATDVTGYGLVGHLVETCRASGVSAHLRAGAIPLLPGALEYARQGHSPGGTATNLVYISEDVQFAPEIDQAWRNLLADPQTSGGLLVSLSPDHATRFGEMRKPDMLVAIIGTIVAGNAGSVHVAL